MVHFVRQRITVCTPKHWSECFLLCFVRYVFYAFDGFHFKTWPWNEKGIVRCVVMHIVVFFVHHASALDLKSMAKYLHFPAYLCDVCVLPYQRITQINLAIGEFVNADTQFNSGCVEMEGVYFYWVRAPRIWLANQCTCWLMGAQPVKCERHGSLTEKTSIVVWLLDMLGKPFVSKWRFS